MNLNFVLMEMTHLRYWMPLVIEGNKRGLQSSFYVGRSGKYNCPFSHQKALYEAIDELDIHIKPVENIESAKGLVFSSEKTGIQFVKNVKDAKKIISTYQTDFTGCYKDYIMIADHVLMPSKFCAQFYNTNTDKNLYLGIPKYDVKINKSEVIKKYNLPESKKFLLLWPKIRDQGLVKMSNIFNSLKELGYTMLVKTRGKDALLETFQNTLKNNGDFYFEDDSWYPHTTQELLEVSDFAINFGSTSIEECVMHNTPLINFDVKPEFRHGRLMEHRVTHSYLYDYNYCVQLNKDFKKSEMIAAVDYVCRADHSNSFEQCRNNHLYTHKNSCKKILDMLIS